MPIRRSPTHLISPRTMQSKPGPLPAPPRNAGPRCRRAGRRLAGAPRRPGPQPPDLRGGRHQQWHNSHALCWRSIRPPPPNNMKCGCDSMFFFCTFSVGKKSGKSILCRERG
uniref:Predicted protein n=1 Tax=Hordeum vulgare subsp. vulgare TaxID=112509 RepID=F2DDR5_HORVV|nr:predicted protein [Hordeum vulgare subsp. vulgare]